MKFLRGLICLVFAKNRLGGPQRESSQCLQTMKAAADHVANTVDDDGNYQALKYLIVI
mgnify:FL=1